MKIKYHLFFICCNNYSQVSSYIIQELTRNRVLSYSRSEGSGMFCVIETATGWRIGNSIFHDGEPHERVFYFSIVYCSRGICMAKGPRKRKRTTVYVVSHPSPPPPTQYSSALRFSTSRFRINFRPIPNIYKEFYWNVSRLSTYPRQPSYPPILFKPLCTFMLMRHLAAFCQSSFSFRLILCDDAGELSIRGERYLLEWR